MSEQSSLLGRNSAPVAAPAAGTPLPPSAMPPPPSAGVDAGALPQQGGGYYSEYHYERKKNCPPGCPFFHHSIREIDPECRLVVLLGLFSWFFSILVLLWNAVAIGAVMAVDFSFLTTFTQFLLALAYILVFGVFINFCLYMTIYTACRKGSATYFFLYMCLIGTMGVLSLIAAAGIPKTATAGFWTMIEMFFNKQLIPGLFQIIAFLLFLGKALFNGFLIWRVHKLYKSLGGLQRAQQEVTGAAWQAAGATREVMVQQAMANKEILAQAAWENREVVAQAAWDNREVVAQAAWENREAIGQALYDNRAMAGHAAGNVADAIFAPGTGPAPAVPPRS